MDERQPIAVQVLIHSIYRRASKPVAITPLVYGQHPVKRTGLTAFTHSRFACPLLCDYEGWSIFMDADMLCLGDVYELLSLADPKAAVSVVTNKDPALAYERPSMMVFNNAECRPLTLDLIERGKSFGFGWAHTIGQLPAEWNFLVGYDQFNPEAKLVHFTQGIPCFPETKDSDFADEWMAEFKAVNSTVSWADIMGASVHCKPVLERLNRARG